MLRVLFSMTTNFTRCAIQTDLWTRIIMERNGSFVSGYLYEILPSAKEPRGDLHVTQNSSEARPNNSFLRKKTGTSLGECLLNCSRKQIISHIQWAEIISGRWSGPFLDQWSTNFLGQWPDSKYFRLCKLHVISVTYSSFSPSYSLQM